MPNRIVREAILTSEPVCSLGWAEEVFYRRLMSIVDDYGRHEANPQLLRSKCYPLQTDAVRVADITRSMAACQKAGVIVLYEVLGKQYLEVCKFGQQQRTPSKFPPPPALDINCNQAPANAHLVVSVVEDVSVTPKAPKGADDRFEAFWAVYPSRVGKEAARKAFAKVNPDAALLEAMVEALAWQSRTEKWTKDKGAYIPNPATWLNAHRWLDEPPLTAGPPSSYNPGIEATQRLLREQAEHAAKATPPPAHILALRSRRSQEVA